MRLHFNMYHNPRFGSIAEVYAHKFVYHLATYLAFRRDALEFRIQELIPTLPVYHSVKFWMN